MSKTVRLQDGRPHNATPAAGPQPVIASRRRRRALITGGAGFIGTNLASHLMEQDFEVVVFDNLSRPGVEKNLKWLQSEYDTQVSFIKGDVRDAQAVRDVIDGCQAVFHFAAQVAVTTSLHDPEEDFEINARGTLNVLQACRRLPSPPAVLFTSTNKVYGDLQHLELQQRQGRYVPLQPAVAAQGIDEDCRLDFHSPYGCSKGTADQYVLDYARCFELPALVFRMSCIYGPHQCGTEDQGWVAHFVRQAIEGEPLAIYGDGCQVRDLLFVEDLVAAMSHAMRRARILRGQAFNVGGGPRNAASVLEVIAKVAALHGRPPVVRKYDWRQGDQRYYVSDIRRVRSALDWSPRVGVDQGLRRLYEWMQNQSKRLAAAV